MPLPSLAQIRDALAGALKEKRTQQGKRTGIILTGGNVDREMYETVLAGGL
jgi:threonine dehydratase